MKVSIADFKNALTLFEAKIVESQATTMNKFALGVALARLNGGTDKMLAPFLDANGMVEVDRLRADVEAGMNGQRRRAGDSSAVRQRPAASRPHHQEHQVHEGRLCGVLQRDFALGVTVGDFVKPRKAAT